MTRPGEEQAARYALARVISSQLAAWMTCALPGNAVAFISVDAEGNEQRRQLLVETLHEEIAKRRVHEPEFSAAVVAAQEQVDPFRPDPIVEPVTETSRYEYGPFVGLSAKESRLGRLHSRAIHLSREYHDLLVDVFRFPDLAQPRGKALSALNRLNKIERKIQREKNLLAKGVDIESVWQRLIHWG